MKLIKSVLMVSLIGLFISCGPFFDRVTVIYGTVKDEKGLPVDSIIVSLSAGYKGRVMMETSSDENGEFQMTMDVPLKFVMLEVFIGFGGNPKFQKFYQYAKGKKNSQNSNIIMIGKKNEYQFELIAK
jgi:hypothetical protein